MTPPSPEPILQLWEIHKTYRTGFWLNQQVSSLQGVTLSVNAGETFGLLGPNGAGKTTLLKIVLGIVRRSSGRATLLGASLGDRAVRQRLGYLPENAYYYNHLSAWEFLSFVGGLFELSNATLRQRIPQLLEWVGLEGAIAKTKPLKQYSKGMLQRVGMAQALINNPDIIFLDEPMSGLDPTGRHRMREIILTLKEQGKTIFFNSHILTDVEQICDRVALLHNGKILCTGTLADLLPATERYVVQGLGRLPEALQGMLEDFEQTGDRWSGQLHGEPQPFLDQLSQNTLSLHALIPQQQSLEAFFVSQVRQT